MVLTTLGPKVAKDTFSMATRITDMHAPTLDCHRQSTRLRHSGAPARASSNVHSRAPVMHPWMRTHQNSNTRHGPAAPPAAHGDGCVPVYHDLRTTLHAQHGHAATDGGVGPWHVRLAGTTPGEAQAPGSPSPGSTFQSRTSSMRREHVEPCGHPSVEHLKLMETPSYV